MYKLFSSPYIFVLTILGSISIVGSIWAFPYFFARNGGLSLISYYIVFNLSIGLVIIIAEMTIGKSCSTTNNSILTLFNKAANGWKFLGILNLITSFLILVFFGTIGGFFIIYTIGIPWDIWQITDTNNVGSSSVILFQTLSSQISFPILAILLLVFVSTILILKERLVSIVMVFIPIFFVMLLLVLLILFFISFNLDNSANMTSLLQNSNWSISTAFTAMGLSFLSLGLGTGIILTFANNLNQKKHVVMSALVVVVLTTITAILAGFTINKIAFSYGIVPINRGLIFSSILAFSIAFPMGKIIAFIFFLLLSLLTLSFYVIILNNIVSALQKLTNSNKNLISIIVGTTLFILIICTYLLNFIFSFKLFNQDLFNLLPYYIINYILPIEGILICMLAGWIGTKNLKESLTHKKYSPFYFLYQMMLKIVIPIVILIIIIHR